MQAYNFNTNGAEAENRRRLWILGVSGWIFFAAGAGLAILAVHATVVRPIMGQFTKLQAQVASLETSLDELAGQRRGTNAEARGPQECLQPARGTRGLASG